VCALVPYPPGVAPSQRFRLEQWAPLVAAEGIDVTFLPFADARLMQVIHAHGARAAQVAGQVRGCLRRIAALRSLARYDLVIVHRTVCLAGPAVLERLIARIGPPLLFDFDDAIYLLHTSAANRAFAWLKFPGKTAAICRLARHVTVSTPHLATYARRHNANVSIVPSSVDTDRYRPPAARPARDKLVVGWTGSATSQGHLELFAPVLADLLPQLRVELHVHSDRPPALAGVPFVWRPWRAGTEAEEIAAFDLGIMPLPDDDWARGKGAMKALLCMALGVPMVCSAVGVNVDLIRHGENGFLARTPEDWRVSLAALVGDPLLRERLGRAGRATVEEGYSARRCAALFAEAVRQAVAPAGGAR
jgi:glycosyltransferase involved in cell wall biosynthesis